MSERRKDFFRRFLLMAGIAALAFMLLGADYPEHDLAPDRTGDVAVGICKEFPADNSSFQKTAAEKPLWFLQCIAQ